MKLKLPQPKSLDLIVVVTFNLIECRAKMHFIFLILGLFLPKKKSDHQAKSISAYCVYLYRHRSVEWCHYKVNYSLQIWQLNCQPCQFFNPLGFTFCILHSVVKVEDKLRYRCQNIHLVPKSFDKYRVRCRSGEGFLAPSIYYRIVETPPQSSLK